MCFSFHIRSTLKESAKLCGLCRLHGWVKKLHMSSGSRGFTIFWHRSKIVREE